MATNFYAVMIDHYEARLQDNTIPLPMKRYMTITLKMYKAKYTEALNRDIIIYK